METFPLLQFSILLLMLKPTVHIAAYWGQLFTLSMGPERTSSCCNRGRYLCQEGF